MLKSIFLPLTFLVLGYGFWISANFKEVSAGVAIFLLGMMALEFGFKSLSGGILEAFLKSSTDKLYKSMGFGIISTTIMQSSSLVSILTISFLGAGLITLYQGIGIIFGANIGTTTGTWLIAGVGLKVDIAAYAMPMLVFGVILIFQKRETLKAIGFILTGLGFLFLGIAYMKEGFEAFKSTIDLSLYTIGGIKGLFIFTAIGIFSTVVMQSSHASLVLIITALGAGQISYENALALAIGANIGTTVTAIIGAMSSNIDGKRLAGAHFIFNILIGIIAIIFIHQIIYLVDCIAIELGIANDDYTLKLAVFHTVFNVAGVLIILPFINKLITFLERAIKVEVSEDELGYDTVRYLSDSVLELPSTAMIAIINETKHLYENSFEIIAHGLNLKKSNIISEMELSEVINQIYSKKYVDIDALYHKKIKNIYGEIIDFSTKAQANMKHNDIKELYIIKLANRELVEAIKDTKHLQKNLIKYSTHPNKHIKEQYANIKKWLAELLRTINIIANSNMEETITQLLSSAKINTERYDIMANGTLDNLIRNHLITNEMATSLMNDSTYAYNISKNLISMAEALFIEKKNDIKDLQEEIIIGD